MESGNEITNIADITNMVYDTICAGTTLPEHPPFPHSKLKNQFVHARTGRINLVFNKDTAYQIIITRIK